MNGLFVMLFLLMNEISGGVKIKRQLRLVFTTIVLVPVCFLFAASPSAQRNRRQRAKLTAE